MKFKTIPFLFVLSIFSNTVLAQLIPNLGGQRAGTSSFTFLKLSTSPRQSAMGGAQTAVSGDGFSANANPASIIDVENLTFGLSNTIYISNINNSYLAAVIPAKNNNTFAVHVQSLRTDAMPRRTEFSPEGTGEFYYSSNMAAGVSFARKLSDYFSYGVTARYVNEYLDTYNVHSGVLDLGFLYKTDFKELKFAVLLNNFGVDSKINGQTQTFSSIPNPDRTTENFSPPTIFKIGVSFVPLRKENHVLLVAAELHHPNDNAENIRIGVEYEYMALLALRAGYKIGIENQPYPTFGFSLKTRVGKNPLRIEYAAEPYQFLGFTNQIGIQFGINKSKREDK